MQAVPAITDRTAAIRKKIYLLINVTDVYGTLDLVSHTPLRGLPFAGALDNVLAILRQCASLLVIGRLVILNCKPLQRVDCD